jgi:hypothetical protein
MLSGMSLVRPVHAVPSQEYRPFPGKLAYTVVAAEHIGEIIKSVNRKSVAPQRIFFVFIRHLLYTVDACAAGF